MAAKKRPRKARKDSPEWHDSNGRFKPGNKGGPGNPNIKRLSELQTAVREAVTAEKLRAVLEKLHELAMDGDVQAARVLMERAMGKPKDAPVTIAMPEIKGPNDLPVVLLRVLDAVASGEINAADGASLTASAREYRESVVMVEMMRRLEALEGKDG